MTSLVGALHPFLINTDKSEHEHDDFQLQKNYPYHVKITLTMLLRNKIPLKSCESHCSYSNLLHITQK